MGEMEIRWLLIGYRPLNCRWIIMWEIGHVSWTILPAFYFSFTVGETRKRSIEQKKSRKEREREREREREKRKKEIEKRGNNDNTKKRGKWKECREKRGRRHGDPKYDAIDVTQNGIPNAANVGANIRGENYQHTILFPIPLTGWVQISRGYSAALDPRRWAPQTIDERLLFYSSFLRWFYEHPLRGLLIYLLILVVTAEMGTFHWFNGAVLRYANWFRNIWGTLLYNPCLETV